MNKTKKNLKKIKRGGQYEVPFPVPQRTTGNELPGTLPKTLTPKKIPSQYMNNETSLHNSYVNIIKWLIKEINNDTQNKRTVIGVGITNKDLLKIQVRPYDSFSKNDEVYNITIKDKKIIDDVVTYFSGISYLEPSNNNRSPVKKSIKFATPKNSLRGREGDKSIKSRFRSFLKKFRCKRGSCTLSPL